MVGIDGATAWGYLESRRVKTLALVDIQVSPQIGGVREIAQDGTVPLSLLLAFIAGFILAKIL